MAGSVIVVRITGKLCLWAWFSDKTNKNKWYLKGGSEKSVKDQGLSSTWHTTTPVTEANSAICRIGPLKNTLPNIASHMIPTATTTSREVMHCSAHETKGMNINLIHQIICMSLIWRRYASHNYRAPTINMLYSKKDESVFDKVSRRAVIKTIRIVSNKVRNKSLQTNALLYAMQARFCKTSTWLAVQRLLIIRRVAELFYY